jgi:hypothetical protein
MTFSVAEVQYLLAAPNAVSGYSLPGTVYNSNGLYCSTTQVDLAVPQNNVFPDTTGPQNASQQVDYQCLFVYNSDTTTTLTAATVWIPTSSIVSSALLWTVGADPTPPSSYTSSTPQAVSITSPYIAPAGVLTWASPSSTLSGGVLLGNILPRQVAALWIRRTATGNPGSPVSFILYTSFGTSS